MQQLQPAVLIARCAGVGGGVSMKRQHGKNIRRQKRQPQGSFALVNMAAGAGCGGRSTCCLLSRTPLPARMKGGDPVPEGPEVRNLLLLPGF